MKIEGSNPVPYNQTPAISAADASKKREIQVFESPVAADEPEFSSLSTTTTLVSQLKQMPDVRQKRVEALREAIQSGRYRVSDRQIADALFAKLLAPKVIQ